MAQATETDDFGFEVIIRSPHVFQYLKKRSSMSSGSACSSYTRNALSMFKCWRCRLCKYPTRTILQLTTLSRHKFCILKSKYDYIGFLDPMRVNERTCLGLYGRDVEDLKQRLIVVFNEFTMKNKTHIHLAYNYEYVFSAFNFMLLFSLRLFDN